MSANRMSELEEVTMPASGVTPPLPLNGSAATGVRDGLRVLPDSPDSAAPVDAALDEVARLPFVVSVLGLPDRHQKQDMEVPSSIGIVSRGVIVPEFTSVAVNDGMGVVITDLRAEDMTAERVAAFFTRVGSHAAAHVLDANRYSLDAGEFRRVLTEGGGGVLAKYGLDASVLGRMEDDACVKIPGDDSGRLADCVPWPLLHGRFSRMEMGLNFGGNHFLELQEVERILDPALAAQWGLEQGQVVAMYHLGPGPFSGTLLHHYSRRSKLDPNRAPLFMLSKLLFHYMQRAGHGRTSAKWGMHFHHNRWTAIDVHSEEGVAFRAALAMATNFGYAYRLATVRAILDGLRETLSPGVKAELLCDISHNGISEEVRWGQPSWVARHNACRLAPGRPTIVAGAWDIPSYLGFAEPGVSDRFHSYDHGAGHLIEQARRGRELAPTPEGVLRLKMSRGRNAQVLRRESVPVLSSGPIDSLMECFAKQDIMRSVVRLRPIGNLKN